MRAVALVLCASLVACFPHDAHKRTLAQLAEGGSIAAGIGIELAVGTGADCDMSMHVPGIPDSGCHTKASIVGDLGLALILAGLVGFIATVSSGEDDTAHAPPPIDIKATPDKPAVQLPPGVVKPPAPALR